MKFKYALALVMAANFFIVSCDKDDINEGITSTEQTIIKLPAGEDEIFTLALDAKPGQVEVGVLEVRRDVKFESELNKTQVVKVSANNAAITAYNTAHGTTYIPFSGYTVGSETPFDGTNYTVTFNPGEFVIYIKFKLDPSTLDLSKKYAAAFKISEASGAQISASKDKALIEIAVKNEFDATYHASGVFHHPTAGDRAIDEDKYLATVGPRSVRANLGDLGGAGYQMILTVNPDNSVTITKAGVTPNIDQSWGRNYYDPATKSFHLHYSYNTAAPRIIEETIKRL